MLVYALDRDYYNLKRYDAAVSQMKREIVCFSHLSQLSEAVERQVPNVIFLECEIPSLANWVNDIRNRYAGVKLIFVTQEKNLTPSQLNLQPDGRMEKPITAESVSQQLFRIAHPILSKWKGSRA